MARSGELIATTIGDARSEKEKSCAHYFLDDRLNVCWRQLDVLNGLFYGLAKKNRHLERTSVWGKADLAATF